MNEALPRPVKPGAGHAGRTGRLAPALALALVGILCACEGVRIAGGTSEVGNPASLRPDQGAADTSRGPVTGFGISAHGAPIRLLREDRENGKTPEAARSAPDSLPVP